MLLKQNMSAQVTILHKVGIVFPVLIPFFRNCDYQYEFAARGLVSSH